MKDTGAKLLKVKDDEFCLGVMKIIRRYQNERKGRYLGFHDYGRTKLCWNVFGKSKFQEKKFDKVKGSLRYELNILTELLQKQTRK